eukprot:CAMPEP_0179339614 /NCGR_PEP_ID=MMETSP0797-20121207/68813_1 /TAXON_ID=47934 /ORGANISM="Dinophysis acuminata, Strain DAEP01" /LENGTH=54 /DNA_ID=CAMNT_0021053465 /DNA_START=16 /DNA_END=177 /DNA_ORIENTATION=+
MMQPRLEAVARAHEIEALRRGVQTSDAQTKASALFKCATMEFPCYHLNNFMTHD